MMRYGAIRHIAHPWAAGWRCWICNAWARYDYSATCRTGADASLAYVPRNHTCSISRSRRRAEGAE